MATKFTAKTTRHRAPMTHRQRVFDVVEQLRAYATRGVFREFAVKQQTAQRAELRFVWLTARPIHARFDAKTNLLTLVDLLPDIKAGSEMDLALRAFVAGRYSASLPAHRRLSKSHVPKVVCVNRRRNMSLRITLGKKDPEAGLRQSTHLISELFQNFLAGPYHEYMVRNFDLRED